MSTKAEYKKVALIISFCLLAGGFLAFIVYLAGKLPQAILYLSIFAIFGAFSFLLFAANRKRGDTGTGVESQCAYAILGVDSNATSEEVRRAYRALARKYHPDAVAEDQKAQMSARLVRINRAYELIGDEDARFEYDAVVRAHDPFVPPLDEAYAHFLQWHQIERAAFGDVQDWNDPNNPDHSPELEASEDKEINADEDPSETNCESDLTPQNNPIETVSGECPACGEPFVIHRSGNTKILCERCGESLSTR